MTVCGFLVTVLNVVEKHVYLSDHTEKILFVCGFDRSTRKYTVSCLGQDYAFYVIRKS